MDDRLKNLRAQAKGLGPILQIGKNGITDGSIELIDRELSQKHLIKIKLLSSAMPEDATKADRKAMAKQMADRTHATVVEQIGGIVVLYRTS